MTWKQVAEEVAYRAGISSYRTCTLVMLAKALSRTLTCRLSLVCTIHQTTVQAQAYIPSVQPNYHHQQHYSNNVHRQARTLTFLFWACAWAAASSAPPCTLSGSKLGCSLARPASRRAGPRLKGRLPPGIVRVPRKLPPLSIVSISTSTCHIANWYTLLHADLLSGVACCEWSWVSLNNTKRCIALEEVSAVAQLTAGLHLHFKEYLPAARHVNEFQTQGQ